MAATCRAVAPLGFLAVIVDVFLHLVQDVSTFFVHYLIVGVIAQTVIVNTIVVVAATSDIRKEETDQH